MELGTCRLKLNEFGSNVLLVGITPAEASVLRKGHQTNAKGEPISGLEVTGKVERTNKQEKERLAMKYANLAFKQGSGMTQVHEYLYPGESPMLPQTFKEAGFEVAGTPKTEPVQKAA